MPQNKLLKFILSIIPALLVYLLVQPTEMMTPAIVIFIAITLWAIIAWAFEIMDSTAIAILLPVLYWLMVPGVSRATAMSGWLTNVPFICVGGFIMAQVMMLTGLGKRIALLGVKTSGGSFLGTIIALAITSLIVAPFIPTVTGKVAMLAMIGVGFCEALGFEKKSKEATIIMLTIVLTTHSARMAFITGGMDITISLNNMEEAVNTLIANGTIAASSEIVTTWTSFFVQNLVPCLLYTAFTVITLVFIMRPDKKVNFKQVALDSLKEMGPVSLAEKKTIALLVILLIALVTNGMGLHPLNTAACMAIAGVATFLPGINLMDSQSLRKVNFPAIFFMLGAVCIGTVGGKIGVPLWLSKLVTPYFEGASTFQAVSLGYISAALLNFILTPMATAVTFIQPLTSVVVELGLDPRPVVYAVFYGVDQFLLPYESAPFLFVIATGYCSVKHSFKLLLARFLLCYIFLIAIVYPYWKYVANM